MILILPNTLLIDIARYLPYSSDRVHFASCCHRLKETVLQEAYRSIDIHYFCEKSLRSLVEILVDTPDVARKVKHSSLTKSKDPPCSTHQFNSHLPQLSINHSVSALIQTLTPSEEEDEQWISAAVPKEECTRLGQDLWLSMLLNCTPNIKSLGMEWGDRTDISERFLAFLSQNNGLSCLTETSIQVPFDWADCFQLYKIAPFFRLPSIRKFKGVLMSGMRGQDRIGFANLIAAKSSPVEHIYLAETGTYDGLEPLVAACRRLKSFTHLARNIYYHIPRPNYTFGEFWIDDLASPKIVWSIYALICTTQTNTTRWVGSVVSPITPSSERCTYDYVTCSILTFRKGGSAKTFQLLSLSLTCFLPPSNISTFLTLTSPTSQD